MIDFNKIARECSIEDALRITARILYTGKGDNGTSHPKEGGTYICPFRDESSPSFSIFRDRRRDGHWRYKDHASGKSGNMINLVAEILCLERKEAALIINDDLGLNAVSSPPSVTKAKHKLRNLKLSNPSIQDFERIAQVVGIAGMQGVQRVSRNGLIGCGTVFRRSKHGKTYPVDDCFVLYDEFTNSASCRKLDGSKFGQHKSISPTDWQKKPIGLATTQGEFRYDESWEFVICEGEKDLIAVMHGINSDRSLPICMPSATVRFTPELAERMHEASCSIYAQADRPGIEAAIEWYLSIKPYVYQTRVFVPKLQGQDWGDLAAGLNAREMENLLACEAAFSVFINEEIEQLQPFDYQPAKIEIATPKKGGSPLNVQNMARVFKAWETLDDKSKESVAEVCKALGVPTRGAERAKVERGLTNCLKAMHADILRRFLEAGVTTALDECNYSDEAA